MENREFIIKTNKLIVKLGEYADAGLVSDGIDKKLKKIISRYNNRALSRLGKTSYVKACQNFDRIYKQLYLLMQVVVMQEQRKYSISFDKSLGIDGIISEAHKQGVL